MKGCQKRIIVIKNTGSNLFEEAYFILREGALRRSPASESDIVGEAARIIAESSISRKQIGNEPRRHTELYAMLRWYIAGVITTALICAAIILLL